ncbi:hypothetical protein CCH79_00017258 [Gambusia affinis]|uniref:NACHT domain-containing protein n=1 Tax=Gambusia affinis TaxID=33528 RepID=A0A315WF28_GAMAF|nr:hypothetical protein CCH79_00017258 [Gambusia affinis]
MFLQDSGAKLLSAGLKSPHCKLEILRLSGCLIEEEGSVSLASALNSNPSGLVELDLSYNNPGEKAKKQLRERQEDPHCELKHLRLEPSGVQWLTAGLKKFDGPHLLCTTGLTGRCYWEVEWEKNVRIAMSYRGIRRTGGGDDCMFGFNNQSWSLSCSDCDGYSAWHKKIATPSSFSSSPSFSQLSSSSSSSSSSFPSSSSSSPLSSSSSSSNKVAVYLDYSAGILSFYKVSSGSLIHLHTFNHTFTESLYAGFTCWTDSSELKENIFTFATNELKKTKNVLIPDYKESLESQSDGEDEKQRNSREAFLKIVVNTLKTMGQEGLADLLQSRSSGVCMYNLKSNLKKKFQCVFEGITKAGNPALLNQIYTELYITEGETGEVNQEHEVRQIETAHRKQHKTETTIKLEDIFKVPPGRDQPIKTVMTKGAAGIGKTVLIQKFTLDWAEDKTNQNIQFIFPFTFRELNVLKEKKFSLVELIHHLFPETKGISSFEQFQVLFIIDSLDETQYIKKKISDNVSTEKSINLFHCLNELNDRSLVEEIQQSLSSGRLSADKLSPAQWSALVFILLSSEKDLDEFDLKKYSPSDETLVRLLPVVKATQKAVMSGCNLSERSYEPLSKVLSSQSSSLRELDLSNNNLMDLGVKLLCDGLRSSQCMLEILSLSGCLITEDGCSSLASALSSSLSNLKELDLSYNNPGDAEKKLLKATKRSPQFKLK